jgi:uncharacterized heparinase superfamily protein
MPGSIFSTVRPEQVVSTAARTASSARPFLVAAISSSSGASSRRPAPRSRVAMSTSTVRRSSACPRHLQVGSAKLGRWFASSVMGHVRSARRNVRNEYAA